MSKSDDRVELFNRAPRPSSPSSSFQSSSQSSMFPAPPALTSLTESLQTAGATVEALDRQNDSLQHSKDLIHNEAYLLTKSDRILRGMGSWSGWAYNTFVKSESTELRNSSTRNVTSVESKRYSGTDPLCISLLNQLNSYKVNVELMSSASSEQRQVLNEVCAEILDKIRGILSREEGGDRKVVFDNVRKELMKVQVDYNKVEVKDEWSELMNADLPSPPVRDVDVTSSSLSADEPMSEQKQILRQQDNDLMQLSQGLETLKSISVSMNESLVEQNKTIEEIDTTTEVCNEKARRVVRRAGRLNRKAGWAKDAVFMGWYVVGLGGGRHFLGVEGEEIVKVEGMKVGGRVKDKVVWAVYRRKEYNCVGFKAGLTDRYIGMDFWGGYSCKSTKFESKQEFEVDDEEKMGTDGTRILSASAGWGKGTFLSWEEGDGGKGGGLKAGEAGRFWIKKVDYIPVGGGGEDGDGH
ncbi:hypothetical protein TrST_g6175 [Triparma strigata]|uniref:t-SNARE coiled-coil homology domain-containing protein n=1 Tax=Triparma strigata TaxID=1606541 RepID=A0A9W7F3C0_9STRA|nr:hypothetical protein TrST_g6175 [Triparma strigata]